MSYLDSDWVLILIGQPRIHTRQYLDKYCMIRPNTDEYEYAVV